MRDGTLKSGERLPSTRALARQLAVSRTVVTEAYQQLYAEGWLDGRHGSGTYVAEMVVHVPPAVAGSVSGSGYGDASAGALPSAGTARPRHGETMIDLRPGQPWVRD